MVAMTASSEYEVYLRREKQILSFRKQNLLFRISPAAGRMQDAM
jgi:hypothetical protein